MRQHILFNPTPTDYRTAVYSVFRQYEGPVWHSGLSIKYVVSGVEGYRLDDRYVNVNAGEFLLAKDDSFVRAALDSSVDVEGLCIDVPLHRINAVAAALAKPDELLGDATAPYDFFESKYNAAESHLGRLLGSVAGAVLDMPFYDRAFADEFFLRLAEAATLDCRKTQRDLLSITAVKPSTRRDLYQRLLRGKEFLEGCFTDKLSVEDAAREARISTYHFFRLFKQAFGVTPYRFVLTKRLSHGKRLLQGGSPVHLAATQSGFSDIHAFSKAFKKHFGVSPSTVSNA